MDWDTLLNSSRPRPSTSTGDHRTQFERDYDRAVFSTPVRRLQDKTQVFPMEPHDAVRTRMTHSLEVSSVARGLATAVADRLKREIDPETARSIETIARTCGLIHDLGNPPFGHAGEDAIRYWFGSERGKEAIESLPADRPQLTQDFLNFEGNAQSLRLVAKLQILSDYNGLNLTYGTLSASCKYTAPSHQANPQARNHAMRKPGYFASENQVMQKIRRRTGTGQARNPIAFLVEAADDIVYAVADVEDGVKKGILSWKSLRAEVSQDKSAAVQAALENMKKILKAGRKSIPRGLPDDVYASAFRTAAIGILVESAAEAFKEHYADIMAGSYERDLVGDCGAAPFVELLKGIGSRRVYTTAPTLKLEIMGRKVIFDLMTIFWQGAQELPLDRPPKTKNYAGKVGALLSDNYRRVFSHFVQADRELPETYHRLQLVTDYVCGMTDSFARRLHAELTNGA